jgi:hypothetical protein
MSGSQKNLFDFSCGWADTHSRPDSFQWCLAGCFQNPIAEQGPEEIPSQVDGNPGTSFWAKEPKHFISGDLVIFRFEPGIKIRPVIS